MNPYNFIEFIPNFTNALYISNTFHYKFETVVTKNSKKEQFPIHFCLVYYRGTKL
jgi:hypothetical protein